MVKLADLSILCHSGWSNLALWRTGSGLISTGALISTTSLVQWGSAIGWKQLNGSQSILSIQLRAIHLRVDLGLGGQITTSTELMGKATLMQNHWDSTKHSLCNSRLFVFSTSSNLCFTACTATLQIVFWRFARLK